MSRAETVHFFKSGAIASLHYDALSPHIHDRFASICLFFQSIQLLYSRRRPNFKFHLGCMILLYFLSTIHIVLAYTWAFITDTADAAIYELFTMKDPPPVLFAPGDPSGVQALATLLKFRWVLANTIADGILIYRCYVIWGFDWRPILFPVLSYTSTVAGGVIELLPLSGSSKRAALIVGYGGVFFTNVLASSLAVFATAGRIWWISRRIAALLDRSPRQSYHNLTAIILESGMVYPALLIITILMFLIPSTPTTAVLGIAPTLIIVRVGLGVSTDNVQTSVTLGSGGGSGSGSDTLKFGGSKLEPIRFQQGTGMVSTRAGEEPFTP
ncbi:hypothetical protein GGX14DRAFT_399228 [Mycena pura]|uniref:Uncharacterized protein n=1 Tax=Mycena pura TaxID=153505 RepID=A0AAD6V8S9_9AGAR|nr:hypothetical protein GGX14DRAFT_399228 [Mycena pura]